MISLVGLLFSMLVSFLAIMEARRHAGRIGIIDIPDHRKVHLAPTPRVGGIGIIAGFFAGILYFQLARSFCPQISDFLALPDKYLLTGAMAIAVAGLVDDLRGINFRQKLVVQALVGVYIILAGYRLQLDFGIFPGYAAAISVPVTLIWIIGVTNAVNLIDGLDGLAGGLFMISLLVVAAGSLIIGSPLNMVLLLCMVGAVLGFLLLNWNPAKTFMGDSGSLFLGYMIACVSLQTTNHPSSFFSFLIPVLAVGLPVFDTLLSMARRSLKGRPMFYPDKDHIHHRVKDLFGLSTRRTVYCLYGINLILGAFALSLSISGNIQGLFVTLMAVGFLLALLIRLEYLTPKKVRRFLKNRRRQRRVYAAPLFTFGK